MYEIILKKPALRFLKKLDKKQKREVIQKIEKLRDNPKIGKPLVGNLSGLWSLRIDKYRTIYQIKQEQLIVFILDVGHRKNIY